ncbi:MAG TPA: protein kinase [Polyangiaceae bacterium]|nr:protein kinase [Polyangiaceae bacterium]
MNVDGLPSIGDTVAGKYRLTRELGRGGMGAVYEAMHLRLAQKVAIKVVLPGVAERPELAYRFEHEARAAARLRGRHTARVYDVDATPEGLRFLVMEFLDGHSLRDELQQRGPLPVDEAVHYVREACEGVDEAHQAGIIHRDIKPANLFLSKEGGGVVLKVVDFGIAKASGPGDDNYHTATNMPLGTYKYMSPEQARSPRSVDARTDVWSLGVTLYQMLAGKVPFEGEGAFGVMYAIAAEEPTPLRSLRPDVPEALAAVVMRALCKNLEGRYQSARELSDALAPFDAVRASLPSRPSGLAWPAAVTSPARGGRASAPALTPALGLAPQAPSPPELAPTQSFSEEQAPTEPLPEAAQASTERGRARALTPPPPTASAAPSPAPAIEAPNESVTSGGGKSHVVPIKTPRPRAGSPALSLWLVGAAVALAAGGGITAGVKAARSSSDSAPLTPAAASEKAAPGNDAPPEKAAPVRAGPSPEASGDAAPDKVAAPPAAAHHDAPAIEPGKEGDAGSARGASTTRAPNDAKAPAQALSTPAARPAAKARPGQPSRDKPGGETAPKPAAPGSPKPAEPAERSVPEVL